MEVPRPSHGPSKSASFLRRSSIPAGGLLRCLVNGCVFNHQTSTTISCGFGNAGELALHKVHAHGANPGEFWDGRQAKTLSNHPKFRQLWLKHIIPESLAMDYPQV
jgi:hypothetical protein